jgi:hypothetical protein
MRIRWTKEEMDLLFEACKEVWETDTSSRGKSVQQLVSEAQKALPETRRRKFVAALSHVPAELRDRLIDAGIGLVRQKGQQRDIVERLRSERDEALRRVAQLEQEIRALRQMPAPPTEGEVLRQFCAAVLREAFGGQIPTGIPKPKHNPEPAGNGKVRIRVAVVGGELFHARLRQEVPPSVDLRLFGDNASGADLRAFKIDGYGTVILWTNKISHKVVASLDAYGIPYIKFTGEIGALLDKIKEIYSG